MIISIFRSNDCHYSTTEIITLFPNALVSLDKRLSLFSDSRLEILSHVIRVEY
jgi:hypothetical protein